MHRSSWSPKIRCNPPACYDAAFSWHMKKKKKAVQPPRSNTREPSVAQKSEKAPTDGYSLFSPVPQIIEARGKRKKD